jgi:hypothetical protein
MPNTFFDEFSAAVTGSAFFYQYRYALLLMLEGILLDPSIEIAVERLDDITVGRAGEIGSAVQTKDRSVSRKPLTNASEDLWKTIRIWSEAVGAGVLNPETVKFLLVTTSEAPPDSIARILRPTSERCVEQALTSLLEVAATSQSASNAAAYAAFRALNQEGQQKLVHAIQVLDTAPSAGEVSERITRAVGFPAGPSQVPAFVRALQGRWLRRIEDHLAAPRGDVITGFEVHDWLHELREQYRPGNLPTELEFEAPPESLWRAAEKSIFVEQLRCIGLSDELIEIAVLDYYRAYEQRGRWVREKLLHLNETHRYNHRLLDEWRHEFAMMRQMLAGNPTSQQNDAKQQAAVQLYRLVLRGDIRIRPDCTAPFVMRGSYHILADEPRLGWHADWEDRFIEGARERRRAG